MQKKWLSRALRAIALLSVSFGSVNFAAAAETDRQLLSLISRSTYERFPIANHSSTDFDIWTVYYDYRRYANACAALKEGPLGTPWVAKLVELDDQTKPFKSLLRMRQILLKLAGEKVLKQVDSQLPNLGWLPGAGQSEENHDLLGKWYGVVGDFSNMDLKNSLHDILSSLRLACLNINEPSLRA